MCKRVPGVRVRFLTQTAVVAMIAGLGAACSADPNRVKEPFFTGSTANQRAIIGAPAAPAMAQGQVPSNSGPVNLVSSQGGNWSAVGGTVVTVGPGESLDTLAIKYGVPSSEIARANAISSPSQVTPGRTMVIPQRTQAAYATADQALPTPAVAAAPVPVTPTGGVHVVESGQTLYAVSRQYGVSVSEIVSANNLQSQNIIVGQRLTIPGAGAASTGTQVAAAAPAATNGAPGAPKPLGTLTVKSPEPSSAPAQNVRVISTAKGADNSLPVVPVKADASAGAAPEEVTGPPSADGTSFRWPVRGRIVSGYGAKADGERNDGINLAVPEGTAVKAAEAGTVIYSGNELAGYGNLVLIRHADGWVSAYAHNSEIVVKRGDTVKRGSVVGKAGATGSVSSPQVHFELRKGAKPVNPMDYLTGT